MYLNFDKFDICPTCNGSGITKKYPYYAKKMPKPISMNCNTCNGLGVIKKIDEEFPKPVVIKNSQISVKK